MTLFLAFLVGHIPKPTSNHIDVSIKMALWLLPKIPVTVSDCQVYVPNPFLLKAFHPFLLKPIHPDGPMYQSRDLQHFNSVDCYAWATHSQEVRVLGLLIFRIICRDEGLTGCS